MNKRIGKSLIKFLLSLAMVFSNVSLTVQATESTGEDTPDQTVNNVFEEDSSEAVNDTVVESIPESDIEETIEEPVQEINTISPQAEETTLSFATPEDLKTFVTDNADKLGGAVSFEDPNTIKVNASGLILLSHVNDSFVGYTIKLNGLSGSPANLTSGFDVEGYGKISFEGLGRSDAPFKGTITSATNGDTSINVILDRPLFNAIDVSCTKLETIKDVIIATAVESTIGFADSIVGNDSTNWSDISIELKALLTQDGENKTYTYPGSCIGTMKADSNVTLGKIKYSSIEGGSFTAKVNSGNGNAGILCNTMDSNSALHVKELEIDDKNSSVTITSSSASAGGLVGCMNSGSSLSVGTTGTTQKLTIGSNWLITGKNAGGIVGEAENAIFDLNVNVSEANIKTTVSDGAAGGIAGFYKLTDATNENVFKSFTINNEKTSVNNVMLDATNSSSYIGGLFGILNPEKDFSIIGTNSEEIPTTISSTAGIMNSSNQYDLNSGTSYGGLVGQVLSENSDTQLAALSINGNIPVTTNLNKDITYYGGLIGIIGKPGIDNANKNGAYVVLNNQVSTTCNNCDQLTSGGHYFGGAIGGMFYDSVFDISKLATFSPNAKNIKYGGGIVGVTGRKSTVRLAGTTNLTDVSFAPHAVGQNPGSDANNRNANGQIVGAQNASIIYAAKSWTLIRPTNPGEIDDIGNYGSVIRLGKNIGQGSSNLADKGGLSDTLIQQDTITHKTSFGIATAELKSGTIEIGSADQFALLSIADQTYGDFGIYPTVTNGFIIGNNKVTKIVLKANIDLSNTGISGLQRDFYNGRNIYTGELDGGNNTLTLDIGQLYANNGETGAGNGQIHGHPQVGLFSQANATIRKLTIDGTIKIRERSLTNPAANQTTSMAVGGAVALSTGSESKFENVVTKVSIQCEGNGTESYIGGLLGLKQGTDNTVIITNNCIGKATITDNTKTGTHMVGGLIGVHAGGGTITVSDTILEGKIAGGSIADAKYGGLVSVIKDNAAKMYLNKLTVNGQRIENSAATSSGGLLGYEWNNTEVYFGDGNSSYVTVQGESDVNVAGNAGVGALVYRATGYWQVNSLNLNKANIQNQSGDLGLLICYGRKEYVPNSDTGTQLLYVEETTYDAYHIDGTNVSISSSDGYFDEWVVYTAKDAETIIDNGNSVISIATETDGEGNRSGFDPTDSTFTGYQNRTTNNGTNWTIANPNARYYYDLDDIREKTKTTNGYIDTPGEAVLWSVWRYCEKVPNGKGGIVTSNIQEYLKTDDIKSKDFKGNEETIVTIDLTGYSYYPVTVDGADINISNCKFVFANQIINNAEEKTGAGLDSMNRNTSGTAQNHTQHYLMHTGLILNYKNTSTSVSSVTLSVNNVTLKGSIGKSADDNGSGAIVCGTVEGSGVGGNHFANVTLYTVTLDNLQVNTDLSSESYAPLLINTIGSYGSIDAQQISTSGYNSDEKAATSLVGHVGNATATNISIAFSNGIALSGRTADSIFTHATLLESFQYLASSSGYYHFKEKEIATYGREINGTVEHVDDENLSKQLLYFDTRNEISDENNKDFNTNDYLPYVYQTKVTDPEKADTFHEVEINIVMPNLDSGCGTYDDPYIIDKVEQLNVVARYIAGFTNPGWKVNIVNNAENIRSKEDANHTLYEFCDQKWKVSGATDDSGAKSESEARDYLRNAYYRISDNLTLNNFSGLGTMDNPFRGVVEGDNHTLTINAEKVSSGFINVSYGSVIQNLNITYTGKKTLSNTNTKAALNSNTVANESYFGGIIGDVKGGDNLVKKVSVTYADSSLNDGFKIKIQNHLQCVGGFFGIVEGGGVILSDMPQPEGLENSHIDTTLDNNNQAYISPLVGRVLDGFVINETDTTGTAFESRNGPDKNYSIGNISKTGALSVTVSDSIVQVTLDEEEDLLLLSSIINSGACNGGWSLAYKTGTDGNAYKANSGKVRNADYSMIGNVNTENKSQYFDPSRNDDTEYPGEENLPYLINEYAGENSELWKLCLVNSPSYLQLNINNNLNMSGYKNGYRGIGGRYNCTATSEVIKTNSTSQNQVTGQFQRNTPVFVGIDGGTHTLQVDNQIDGYSDDNFVANAAGGLVNVLRRKVNTLVTVQNLTVKGNVELHDFSDQPTSTADKNASGRSYASSVGGVIGRYFTEETSEKNDTYLFLTNLSANDLTLYSDGATGGIVGQTGTKKFFIFGPAGNQYASGVTYTDCSYSNLTAMSCQSTGGIVGAACDNADSYYYSGVSNDMKVTNRIVASRENFKTGYDSTLSVYANSVSGNGLGGLIGNVGSNVEINKDGAYPLVLDQITLQDKIIQGVSRTGGAIGFLHHGITKAYNITISNSTLGNGKEDNLGGIVGCWFSSSAGGVMENIVIDSCKLDASLSVGGVIGYINKAKNIKNITVKNTTIKQRSDGDGRGVAMVVGQIYTGGIYGENILLKDNNIECTSTASKGRIVGRVDSSQDLPIQLLGVSVQYAKDASGNSLDASQPTEDIGSIKYTDYPNKTNKIFISYDAFLTDKTVGSELAQWPYVEILGVGFEETVDAKTTYKITGDTVKPYTITGSNSITGIVKKEGDVYSYIGSKKTYQYVDPANVDRLVPGIVSTYNANQDTKVGKDFDVIQIDGSAACLKQYLNAATNGAFDTGVANGMAKVEISRYKWNSEKNLFEDVTNQTGMKQTLAYDAATGDFYATAEYDNQKNMFTLVTVTFNTTSNNYTRTYHIPVVVRRMLQVDVMATMVSGTVFNSSEMINYNTHALASEGEDITGYLTFKYNSNLSGNDATYDWQNYMEAGANLLGYYKKTMDTGSTSLPIDTKITLIDCQNEQRQYQTIVTEEMVNTTNQNVYLELFGDGYLSYKDSDGNLFNPVTLSELLEITATKYKDDTVKWVQLKDDTGATVKATDGNYYRLYDDKTDSDITNLYTLTVGNPSPEENYYVVISIPQQESHMLTLIKDGGTPKGSMTWSDPNSSAPPTEIHQIHRYTNSNGNYERVDTNKSSEISFNYLNNYEQRLEDIISEPTSVSVNREDELLTMQFDVVNEVSFDANNYEKSDPLYQEFRVSLNKTIGQKQTEMFFPSDASALIDLYTYYKDGENKVYFKIGGNGVLVKADSEEPVASYEWTAGTDGNMVLPFATLNEGVYHYLDLSPVRQASNNKFYIEVKARNGVTIGMSSVVGNELLPSRDGESTNQTTLHFISHLSFKENGLSYSTLRGTAEGKIGYYFAEKRQAVLELDYLNVDQLGINVSDTYTGEIDTMVTLDFSESEGFSSNLSEFATLNEADKVVFTFSLNQKVSVSDKQSVQYNDVNIETYINRITITGQEKVLMPSLTLTKSDGTYPYYNETIGVFSIPITFKVNTELPDLLYSNYRIYVTATAYKNENPVEMSVNTEKAFITYTLAKINTNGYWETPASTQPSN